MPEALRSGAWLTTSRRRAYAWIILALSMAALIALIATANGIVAYNGKPLGTDFSSFYSAGTLAHQGKAAAAYDWPTQHAEEKAIFGPNTPFYGWHYPPFFLTVAAGLATMPYLLALFVWQATTLALYLRLATAILPGAETVLLAAAAPAVFVNLGHGQNGFLTASLLTGALLVLDRRPLLAGLLIGLLAYKPQFGVLIPFVLIATGRWRVFFSAALTVLAMAALATLAFGTEIWSAFIASLTPTQTILLEAGVAGWEKLQSVFSAVRMWGSPVPLAKAVHGVVAIAVAIALIRLWRSRAAFDLKAAGLCLASLLATPYTLDYDMVVLGAAIAFFVRHGLKNGFGPYELTLTAAVWAVPLVARQVAAFTLIPLGVIVTLAFFVLVVARAVRDQRAHCGVAPTEVRHAPV